MTDNATIVLIVAILISPLVLAILFGLKDD